MEINIDSNEKIIYVVAVMVEVVHVILRTQRISIHVFLIHFFLYPQCHRGWGMSCIIGVASGHEISTRPFSSLPVEFGKEMPLVALRAAVTSPG